MIRKALIKTACLTFFLVLFAFAWPASFAEDNSPLDEAGTPDCPSFWAESSVESARAMGLIPDDLCSLWQEPITRLDFCRLVSGLLDPAEREAFPDCSEPAVVTCASRGIISGFDDGLFHPDELLTRQQAAVILRRAAEHLGMEAQVPVYIVPTADAVQPSIWACEAVRWVMDRGIMTGTGEGRFDPSGSYTREQSVVTLMNLLEPAVSEVFPVRSIDTDNGSVEVFETDAGCLSERNYVFADGTGSVIGRVNGGSGTAVLLTAFLGENASICMTDGSGWSVSGLSAGSFSGNIMYLFDGEKSFLFVLPQQYRLRENNCLEYLPGRDGELLVYRNADGYSIRLLSRSVEQDCVCDYLAVGSPRMIFGSGAPGNDLFSGTHALHSDGRWCNDGYYYICPSTYVPSGENVFYRNTSCYFGTRMAESLENYPGCEILCLMIDDTTMLQQNSEGFLPQLNESTWLSGDYGIGAGYYDTRFNSDLMEAWMRLYNFDHASSVAAPLEKYMDFFVEHAAKHHQTTASGGWLVEDYYNPAGGSGTHTSLNHQLAEASVLYKAAAILDDPSLAELADKMILAVEDTAQKWIRDDSNLHYSISVEGEFGGNDYPYLTYNDLYNMQELLEKTKGSRSSALQSLMDEKLKWMTANGVHGYKGE